MKPAIRMKTIVGLSALIALALSLVSLRLAILDNASPLAVTAQTEPPQYNIYLPVMTRGLLSPVIERRALWVTRYDWISWNTTPTSATLESVIEKAYQTGFNTILFQVRAAGDAYYTPGLEPWSEMLTSGPVSTTLGMDPGWDPLDVAVQAAHARGMELHAYVNVYTAWMVPYTDTVGFPTPPAVIPPQMYDRFTFGPGDSPNSGIWDYGDTWIQHNVDGMPMSFEPARYVFASPGVDAVQDHIVAVIMDIYTRYDVDGIHLDYVRYAGQDYSYDPFSNGVVGSDETSQRADWQRQRVTDLVSMVQTNVHALGDDLVSAAVWPYYEDSFGWGTSSGYHDYYQDSKGWLQRDEIDAIMPMLYNGLSDDLETWVVLMHDFVDMAPDAQVYPGVGADYDNFSAIEARIHAARQAGAPGHAVFSYGGLEQHDYWEDLKQGPYLAPAHLP